MDAIRRLFRTTFVVILLKLFLIVPLFATFTACGDEKISGPRVEEDQVDPNDRDGGDDGE